jgi:hypothetical protein
MLYGRLDRKMINVLASRTLIGKSSFRWEELNFLYEDTGVTLWSPRLSHDIQLKLVSFDIPLKDWATVKIETLKSQV